MRRFARFIPIRLMMHSEVPPSIRHEVLSSIREVPSPICLFAMFRPPFCEVPPSVHREIPSSIREVMSSVRRFAMFRFPCCEVPLSIRREIPASIREIPSSILMRFDITGR